MSAVLSSYKFKSDNPLEPHLILSYCIFTFYVAYVSFFPCLLPNGYFISFSNNPGKPWFFSFVKLSTAICDLYSKCRNNILTDCIFLLLLSIYFSWCRRLCDRCWKHGYARLSNTFQQRGFDWFHVSTHSSRITAVPSSSVT